jgi:membrane associated rhomboid family serine protease
MFPLRDDRPTYTPPIVTTLIMIACALVFLFELSLDEYSRNYLMEVFGLVPTRLHVLNLFTSLFLHAGWMHIIGNMLFLWAFGKSLEDAMGHTKFLIFYFACGVAAGLTHCFFNYYSNVPTVGASGAIAGVMGAYLIKFPRAYIHTLIFFFFITLVDIPAAFILIYWFVTQLFSGVGSIASTRLTDQGVAWFAHIGGFVSGMILVKAMGTRQRYFPRRDIYW